MRCLSPVAPDRLAPVSGPQERVQRHIVEQPVDPVRGLPVLDAPVPQVEQLVEVLIGADDEQLIEVPKLAQEDRAPLRAVLREPQVVETVGGGAHPAHGHSGGRQGRPWHSLAPRVGKERRDLLADGRHQPQQEGPPGGIHPQPRAVFKYWAALPA